MLSKAVVFAEYGGPDVLRMIDVDVPDAADGQVRLAVAAAGVQPFDAAFRAGDAAEWLSAAFPQQLGNELTGTVQSVGPDVTALAAGDEVLGWVSFRGYAEHAVVGVNHLVPKPAGMPWPEAGVLSASGQTAATTCKDLAVGSGDTLLVHAAAGGVGSFAVQIARAHGATVVGTASERNHDYLRSLGVIPVAYGDGLTERIRSVAPGGVDAALDAAGTEEALRVSTALVADRQRIGTLAGPAALADELGVRRLGTRRSTTQLTELTELYGQGKLRVTLHRTFPLDQAADAHREIASGHVRGKIALTTAGETR